MLADAFAEQTGCARMVERSDADVRRLEGLATRAGVMRGDAPAAALEIVEHGVRHAVDVLGGQNRRQNLQPWGRHRAR